MKLFFTLLVVGLSTFSYAQQTFNITWMMGITLEQASVTINTGDMIVWTLGDGAPHTVQSEDPDAPGTFGSGPMQGSGQTYQFTFNDVAVIDYHCGVHGSMQGVITVVEALSVEEKFAANLKYYPTITSSKLTITSLLPVERYEIYDAQVRKVAEGVFTNVNYSILDVSALSTGVYFVTVVSKDELKTAFKIVKE
ncbi:T9SS type A sorting domain-containing protein [Crocinitomicaceae bacterium CZZ-1]|uniref:T9SS type A sorting domain-containing protein n=1 Tax=Taishania pollutisoli TaxID=2766479 RepID=A0A8J6U0N4_9FLAO|nr:T9SS type A sorting domain-containing protein [Taishania pollutisoli]MBC9813478.1 T9SS type A sorting domain-containing protein [Taishania pollutisoli]